VIPDSPYKGLVPFEDSELDALLFFGRERESGIISENVLAARLTVLYGPSGVGKTSVLRAGVAHHLRRQAGRNVAERGHPEFVVVVFDAWSEDPVGSLRAAVREELAAQFGSALLDEEERESLADTFGRWTEGFACDLLLILDQAEEYFLYHQREGGFAVDLPDLVTRPGLRVRVLLSLRDDALAKLDRFKGRIPSLFANYLRLDHLDRRSAGDAVLKPVERYNELTGESIEVEPALVEAVLNETAAGQVDLGSAGRGIAVEEEVAGRIEAAYLQLVLERLWEDERAAGSSRLRVATLASLGGAESIVRAHLRRAVEGLSSEERDVAADVFRFLVTPSGAKIAHGASDLAEYAAVDEERMLPVLSTLGRERIVRTVDGAGTNGARYEIFHDVLGEPVLAWRREQELEREHRKAERRHRRLAMVTAVALLALAAMTAVAIYALSQRSDARASARSARASERATRARELGALAQSDLVTDPLRSVRLALQAAKLDPTPAAADTLRTALIDSRVRKILHAGRGPVNAAAYSPDGSKVVTASEDGTARVFRVRDGSLLASLRHGGSVTDATFSSDGRWIVTSSRDKTARLWTASGRPIRTFRHDGAVLDVALSPDSKTLVTLADDATLHVWSLTGGGRSFVFDDVPGNRLALSRDGNRAAVVGADRYARVYSLAGESLLGELPHDGLVRSAAFGPSSDLLATGSADKLARVWALAKLRLAYLLRGHQGQVVDVAVSPQGQFVATASLDGTGAIWNIATVPARLAATLSGHSNFVNDVDFSPDGLYVVTSSRDGTARVWKTKGGTPQAVLAGHKGSVQAASFDPTGSKVLTYSGDGTARIWDAGTTPELRPLGRQPGLGKTLDLTATRALTAGRDGTAGIWNLRNGRSTRLRHSGPVRDAAFSPNGRFVVTASADHTAGIWTSSGVHVHTFSHPVPVNTAAFSPDSRLVATGAADGRVRIWNVDSAQPIETLPGRSSVDHLAFDPKRGLLAAAASDHAVRLWSTSTWKPERTLRGHHGRVTALSFSHNGKLLLTGSTDTTAKVWNLDSGRAVTLSGHRDDLTSARFSPDDRLVATASVDHDVRLWNALTGSLVRPVLRAHFGAVSDARFSDDGRWLVSAGPGAAGLWQVRTHRLVTLLRGRPFGGARGPTGRGSIGVLYAAGFLRGGSRIVTTGQDGVVRTYLCRVCADIGGLERLAAAHLAEVGTGS
jgi:WD40 repeat protein